MIRAGANRIGTSNGVAIVTNANSSAQKSSRQAASTTGSARTLSAANSTMSRPVTLTGPAPVSASMNQNGGAPTAAEKSAPSEKSGDGATVLALKTNTSTPASSTASKETLEGQPLDCLPKQTSNLNSIESFWSDVKERFAKSEVK
jgi:hypothetical protein